MESNKHCIIHFVPVDVSHGYRLDVIDRPNSLITASLPLATVKVAVAVLLEAADGRQWRQDTRSASRKSVPLMGALPNW
jgi:hypothetical protein